MVPRGRRAHKHSIFKAILIGCGTFPPGRILLAIIVLHLGVCGESAVIPRIESLIRTREYNHALELTKSALHDTPNDVRLWTLEGIILSMQNENPKALAAFDKALSLSPNYIAALKGKIEVLYQAEDKRAIPVLRHILQLDPRDETAHEMLAVFEARSGNCQPAIDQFLSSTNAIANHPRSLELYGYCLQRTKQAQRAVAVFEQLAALAPEQTYPKYDLAVVLVEAQQNAAAIKALEPLLTPNQSDPEVFSLAAEAYEAVGDTPNAVSHLRQAIVLNPKIPTYYTSFALLCLDHESYQVGIDMLTLGLHQISGDSSLFVSRGLLYAQLADYEKAEADFKMAESLNSAQNLSSYALDLAELERDHPNLALSKVRSQLKLHPDSAQHHYLLAELLEKQTSGSPEMTKEAILAAETAVHLKPSFLEARDLLAGLYISSGQYALAKRQCELALKYDPFDQTAIYHLIVALRHSTVPSERQQIPSLVKRLAEAQQFRERRELNRKRFRLVEPAQGEVAH